MWPVDNRGRIADRGECRNAIIGSSSSCFFLTVREQHAHSILDYRTFLSDRLLGGRGKMDKRDRFIAELRHEAKLRGLSFKSRHAAARGARHDLAGRSGHYP